MPALHVEELENRHSTRVHTVPKPSSDRQVISYEMVSIYEFRTQNVLQGTMYMPGLSTPPPTRTSL